VLTVTHFADPDALRCTCEGGGHVACVHQAAVYLAKLEAQGLRPVLPAPPPAAHRRRWRGRQPVAGAPDRLAA
jgi:hypothetical protein